MEDVTMHKIKLILLTAFFVTMTISSSEANNIFLQGQTQGGTASGAPVTEIAIDSPSGNRADFELLVCATFSDGSNDFNNANPGWSTEDVGGCGGAPDCILGIFARFDDSTQGVENQCSWDDGTEVFSGGILRYTGVDSDGAILGEVECNTGTGFTATAPSVFTEAGSVVVRIFAADAESFASEVPNFGLGNLGSAVSIGNQKVLTAIYGEPFSEDGDSGTAEFDLNPSTTWRACSVALNSLDRTVVPTLGEWGLIAMAGVLGFVGFVAIRRRAAA
jgi:IPTL-CTERM motif